ncbi:L-seryl-tRNA(Sec) selenium transferase [Caulobacter sp. S45]|uniref:L-seryl-tRNA(Sec) selenium transferase n=1 Tax=Caulobacter sp. S45 TaxID=1641861 RepID=UPI001575EE3F|nr:L-seryl-tRNA(Sec) selenium transferase [Caulobacter sp. S45]
MSAKAKSSGGGWAAYIRSAREGGLILDDAPNAELHTRLRALPSVERLLEQPEVQALQAAHGREPVVAGARACLDAARTALRRHPGAEVPALAELSLAIDARLARAARPVLHPLINATGIVLHTNLGRAPLASAAAEAAAAVASGYSNLEFDLEAGRRGARTQGVEPLLCEITGAEAALAVNNAAAAVLLALSALASGGEVVVSRGELVEIGGGFRIPDVITQGGAKLVEVGTTNRTRSSDYASAITPATRVLLKVHPSNYRMLGFTGEAGLEQLAALARERGLILMHDLGGGALVDLRAMGLPHEPTVQESLAAGADLVAFSGDKLMGGPQAGLLVGRAAVLEPLRRHPLLRAVRLDKMTLAALEATLQLYRDPARAAQTVPVLAMLDQTVAALQARAERLGALLDASSPHRNDWRVEPSEAFTGGGTLPTQGRESRALVWTSESGAELTARRLRTGAPAVVGRVRDGALVFDMLTVSDAELDGLAGALEQVRRS